MTPEEGWERACYRAGTQGLINVLCIGGGLFAILLIVGLIANWMEFK